MTEFHGNKNLPKSQHKIGQVDPCFLKHGFVSLLKSRMQHFFEESFEDPEFPTCSPLSSGLDTITADASCRGFWSLYSERFEF